MRSPLNQVMVAVFLLWMSLTSAAATLAADASDLGDVGYFYSEVSPFLCSTVVTFNPNPDIVTATVTLRNDIGSVVYTQTKTIDAGAQWLFVPADVGLHGIFHGEVHSSGDPLSVFVSTQSAGSADLLASGYMGVPIEKAADHHSLNDLHIDNQTQGGRDVEIVVQNLQSSSNQVIFTICPADGLCFANNAAILPSQGRRSFLLSHLAYSNRYAGGLTAVTGSLRVTVESEPNKPVAVVTNHIKRNAAGKAEWEATLLEQGNPGVMVVIPNEKLPELQAKIDSAVLVDANWHLYIPLLKAGQQDPGSHLCSIPGTNTKWSCAAEAAVAWGLPFVAAPNVPFVEDPNALFGVGYPWQGIQQSGRSLDTWPALADLNWYNWMANANWSSRLAGTLWGLCESDPHYFPMVWSASVSRNTVPSSCAGRPLLLVNEPVYYRLAHEHNDAWVKTWTDDAVADTVFRHSTWPGDLYCCGYTEWPGFSANTIAADDSDYATFGNVLEAYESRFGVRLPIDGVHLHFYLTLADIDMTAQAPTSAALTHIRDRATDWIAAIDATLGSDIPIIISEYGVLTQGANQQSLRNVVKAGLDELTETLVTIMDGRLVRMYYFQVYWGAQNDTLTGTDIFRPLWLVGSEDGSYALDEINDVGHLFLDLSERYKP